jgi:hypothetical protein
MTNTRTDGDYRQYISEAIRTVELELDKVGKALSNSVSTPMSSNYRPELEVSPLLDPPRANYYQSLIGILRWIVELGRIAIHIHAVVTQYPILPYWPCAPTGAPSAAFRFYGSTEGCKDHYGTST